MEELLFFFAVWGTRLLLVAQIGVFLHAIFSVRKEDGSARVSFGFLSFAECAIAVAVSISAVLSDIDLTLWPMVIGLPVLANALVFLIRYRLIMVGKHVVLAGSRLLSAERLSCRVRGVALEFATEGHRCVVWFPMIRWDAVNEMLSCQ